MAHKQFPSIFVLFALFILFSSPADAQLRSQGKVLTDTDDEDKIEFAAPVVDHASEMRRLIQNIAKYGRNFKRDFVVLIKDGTGLLTQVIDVDQLISAPSSAFIRTLDGVVQSAPMFGMEEFGEPTGEKDRDQILKDLQVARDTGLKVFTLDYASKPADVDKAIRFADKNKFVPFVAPGKGIYNNKLPKWPRRPHKENQFTITNSQMVNNYLLINDSSRFGTADEYALKIHNTNYDMVITNVFHHRSQTHGRHNVQKMQFKKLGTRRPVLARFDIGTADVSAFYWQDNWRTGNPTWVQELAPFSSDKYLVQYWHPTWHQLMYGNTQSYLYGIIREGYDGVLLEGVDAFEIFANPE